jgi:hypothetical protein
MYQHGDDRMESFEGRPYMDRFKGYTEARKTRKTDKKRDLLYCRQIRTNKNTLKLSVEIGKDLANVLSWKSGDNVKFLVHDLDPRKMILVKSMEKSDYTLSSAEGCTTLNVSKKIDRIIDFPLGQSIAVQYDYERDTLMIDMSIRKDSAYREIRENH